MSTRRRTQAAAFCLTVLAVGCSSAAGPSGDTSDAGVSDLGRQLIGTWTVTQTALDARYANATCTFSDGGTYNCASPTASVAGTWQVSSSGTLLLAPPDESPLGGRLEIAGTTAVVRVEFGTVLALRRS